MKKILLMGFVLCIVQVQAQETPIQREINAIPSNKFSKQELFEAKKISIDRSESLAPFVKTFNLMKANSNILNRIVSDATPSLEVDIPMNGSFITLQLARNEHMTTQGNEFKTTDGKIIYALPGAYYYGVIKNQLNSFVDISFFNDNII